MRSLNLIGRQKLYGVIGSAEGGNKIILLDENSQIVDQIEIDDCAKKTVSHLMPFKSYLQGIVVTTVVSHSGLIENLVDSGFKVHLITVDNEEVTAPLLENELSLSRKLAKRLQTKIRIRKHRQVQLNWPDQFRLSPDRH